MSSLISQNYILKYFYFIFSFFLFSLIWIGGVNATHLFISLKILTFKILNLTDSAMHDAQRASPEIFNAKMEFVLRVHYIVMDPSTAMTDLMS